MAEQEHAERFDAVVVGSGIGGMTAAAYLAASGRRTLVLEAYDVIGGSTHVFRRAGKWEFDVGTHYLGDCGPDGVMPTILRGVGLGETVEFLPLDPDGFDHIVLPDRTIKIPVGWDRFRAVLLEAFPDDERAIKHFTGVLERLGRAIDHVHTPRSLATNLTFAVKAGTAARWALRPLSQLLDAVPMSPGLKAALGVHYGTYASPPTRTPVMVHALMMDMFMTTGAWFPRGGGQTLSARLGEVILSNGGEIRTRTRVARILVEKGKAVGVELADGTRITAPVVVSNADIKQTYGSLLDPEAVSARTRRRVAGYRMSQPFFNTYIGLDIDLRKTRSNSNYFALPTDEDVVAVYRDLAENANNRTPEELLVEIDRRLGAFIHVGSVKDPDNPRLAPPGCTSVEVMTMVSADPQFWGLPAWPEAGDESYSAQAEYQRIKDAVTEIMVKRLIQAIPEAEGHIVWKEAASPLTQHRYTSSTDGTPYGIEMSLRQFGPLRPGVRTEITGLYVCGASYSWGSTVAGAMLSGLHAAAAVEGRDLYRDAKNGVVLGHHVAGPAEPDYDPLAAAKRVATRGRRKRVSA
ncbi:phytoene desaturase family protein [Janibacter hoylei]|uniref:phytoene desaturase family protein n=1 Tax=Janibacter hoylei TaxID=364298 RepID=UPI0021A4296E|nr:NAD(P)/FAD-dependent oxidoreductase [Janibacter hoylei]MCT1618950.1 NAD(P)/FAD-dependent oxidoreductase [Janibacter hoylei]MCT2291773.1 NAD(P)/FAD-dependent oxidoreductase [Janibacter hoylei]